MIEILKNYLLILAAFLLITNVLTASGNEFDVNITNEISFIDVKHNGKEVRIQRNQSLDNLVNSEYAKTSRKCPPFCIQPHNLGNGVETIGELELLNYLEKSSSGDNSILIIDSRTENWVKKGTIVIDVGINKTDSGLVGDVDFNGVSKVAKAITPVPGGVGPMTIACLLNNTVECFKKAHSK